MHASMLWSFFSIREIPENREEIDLSTNVYKDVCKYNCIQPQRCWRDIRNDGDPGSALKPLQGYVRASVSGTSKANRKVTHIYISICIHWREQRNFYTWWPPSLTVSASMLRYTLVWRRRKRSGIAYRNGLLSYVPSIWLKLGIRADLMPRM